MGRNGRFCGLERGLEARHRLGPGLLDPLGRGRDRTGADPPGRTLDAVDRQGVRRALAQPVSQRTDLDQEQPQDLVLQPTVAEGHGLQMGQIERRRRRSLFHGRDTNHVGLKASLEAANAAHGERLWLTTPLRMIKETLPARFSSFGQTGKLVYAAAGCGRNLRCRRKTVMCT